MTNRQEKAIAALLTAPTRTEAAKIAGVGVSTLRRWMTENTEFQDAYRDALTDVLSDASAEAARNASQAIHVLSEIMVNDNNSQTRITAARSLLEYALKLHDLTDTRTRIKHLELMIEGIE